MKRKFTKEELYNVIAQEDNSGNLELVEQGKWEDEGKYQYQECIVKAKDTGKFYSYCVSKSGSYFTDFTFSWDWEKDVIECAEVHKVTKTVEVWEAV